MQAPLERYCADEAATRALGREWVKVWTAGDLVLLEGDLGAGKTTFVRGVLEGLGHQGPVRSPTFNLLQTFPTVPPVLHVDLYRLPSAQGLGLDEFFESHLVLVEWPERAPELRAIPGVWQVKIVPKDGGRLIVIER